MSDNIEEKLISKLYIVSGDVKKPIVIRTNAEQVEMPDGESLAKYLEENYVSKAGDEMTESLIIRTANSEMLVLRIPDLAIGEPVEAKQYRGIAFKDKNNNSLSFLRVVMLPTGYPQLQTLTNNGGGIYSFFDAQDRRNKTYLHVLEDSTVLDNNEIFSYRWFKANGRRKLTANKNFYVSPAGSDTLTDGRGESAALPFKTIQVAVRYIGEHFDLGRFSLTINLAPGTYDELFSITPPPGAGGNLVIKSSGTGASRAVITGGFNLYGASSIYFQNVVFGTAAARGALVVGGVSVTLENCAFVGCSSTSDYAINCYAGSVVVCTTELSGKFNNVFNALQSGEIIFKNGSMTLNDVTFDCFALARTGRIYKNRNYAILGSGTGKRYAADANGLIYVYGAGPNVFPGTIAGTCDAGGQYI